MSDYEPRDRCPECRSLVEQAGGEFGEQYCLGFGCDWHDAE